MPDYFLLIVSLYELRKFAVQESQDARTAFVNQVGLLKTGTNRRGPPHLQPRRRLQIRDQFAHHILR